MTDTSQDASALCGVWIDPAGTAHTSRVGPDGTRLEATATFLPFAWAGALPPGGGYRATDLAGGGRFGQMLTFESLRAQKEALREYGRDPGLESVRPAENAWLLQRRERLFGGLPYSALRRLQLAVESTPAPRGEESPSAGPVLSRILLRGEGETCLVEPEEPGTPGERSMLFKLNALIRRINPDTIEGHGLFNDGLTILRDRCRALKVPLFWGRFGQKASFRTSRLRAAERWIDFTRCDIPGRTVVDLQLLAQLYDVTYRVLPGYTLSDLAGHFFPGPWAARLERVPPRADRGSPRPPDPEVVLDAIAAIADVLLPTYVAQVNQIPMTLQEALLRGTAGKVDLLLLEEYYHSGYSLPDYPEVERFEGAFTRSFRTGVFQKVLHFDVASLYPSLLIQMGRNPAGDHLGIFIPALKRLRELRLEYKALARDSDDAEKRREYQARQASFKILINSFYGYLGFAGGRFADSSLAAEVTRRGRGLLQQLILRFEEAGCPVLEADTDGLYLEAGVYWDNPDRLLARVSDDLPEGIALEFDGHYEAMLCYKAKNYALYDGGTITVRGSALRSRGTEPFLGELTGQWVAFLLGAAAEDPRETAETLRQSIREGSIDAERLARAEYLSQSPEAYANAVESGNKPRRASLEVARRMNPQPRMGERVRYLVAPRQKGKTADWQRAFALDEHSTGSVDYDPVYYEKKLDDWLKRHAPMLEEAGHPAAAANRQGDLF